MTKQSNRIVILGAGLAGLSAGWHLAKMGIPFEIYEKEKESGGLCRSRLVKGFTFDRCGHLLHFRDAAMARFAMSLLSNNLIEHKKNAWIYSHKKFTRFPFQANTYGLPSSVMKECLLGMIMARKNRSSVQPRSFYDWILSNFGSGVARHFMVPYNEKFWNLHPRQLNCEWLEGFIPVPSLREVVDGTLAESRRSIGYNAVFWYPREGGIQVLPRRLEEGLKGLYAQEEAVHLDLRKRRVTFKSGKKTGFDKMLFTLPLPLLKKICPGLPSEIKKALDALRYTSVYNLNLGVSSEKISDKHWVYFPERRFIFYRLGFPGNFSPRTCPEHKSSLYIEVSYSPQKPLPQNDILGKIEAGLLGAGVLQAKDKIEARDINLIPYGYVIYDRNRRPALERIIPFLSGQGVECLGRYGSWSYKSMEDCLRDGKEKAQALR